MRKKRIMIIGPGRSGKTSLGRYLDDRRQKEPGRELSREVWTGRTPALVYRGNIIEGPGAYLESPWMRHHLISAAQDAYCVLMLVDPTGKRDIYPPGFATVFPVPVLGIATKWDLIREGDGQDWDSRKGDGQEGGIGEPAVFRQLARAKIKPPFLKTSILDNTGLEALWRQVEAWRREASIPLYELTK